MARSTNSLAEAAAAGQAENGRLPLDRSRANHQRGQPVRVRTSVDCPDCSRSYSLVSTDPWAGTGAVVSAVGRST